MVRGDGREEPGAVAKRPKGPVESKWPDYMEEQLGAGRGKNSPASGLESSEGRVCQPGGPCNRRGLREAGRTREPASTLVC